MQLSDRAIELSNSIEEHAGGQAKQTYLDIEVNPKNLARNRRYYEPYLCPVQTHKGTSIVFITKASLDARYRYPVQSVNKERNIKTKLVSLNSSEYKKILEIIDDHQGWFNVEFIVEKAQSSGETITNSYVESLCNGLANVSMLFKKDGLYRLAEIHDKKYTLGSLVLFRPFDKGFRRYGVIVDIKPHAVHPIDVFRIKWINGVGEPQSILGSDIAVIVSASAEQNYFLFGGNGGKWITEQRAKIEGIRDSLKSKVRIMSIKERLVTNLKLAGVLTIGQCVDIVRNGKETDRLLLELRKAGKIKFLSGFPKRVQFIP